MTEIPPPPHRPACSACMQPITWLYSARTKAWVGFVPAPSGGPHAITPHPCRDTSEPPTWRTVRPGSEPTAEYLAAKAALPKPAPKEKP